MANELDPSVRINILDALMKRLYTSSNAHRNKNLCRLIRNNSVICNNTQDCFSFRREIYEEPGRCGPYPQPMNMLSNKMRDEVKEYISDAERVDAEQVLVKGYLQRAIALSHQIADYMAVIPSALHPQIKNFNILCEPGDGSLTSSEIEKFKHDNARYLEMVRTRLTMNLINAP